MNLKKAYEIANRIIAKLMEQGMTEHWDNETLNHATDVIANIIMEKN